MVSVKGEADGVMVGWEVGWGGKVDKVYVGVEQATRGEKGTPVYTSKGGGTVCTVGGFRATRKVWAVAVAIW